jgi:hypothetical protein
MLSIRLVSQTTSSLEVYPGPPEGGEILAFILLNLGDPNVTAHLIGGCQMVANCNGDTQSHLQCHLQAK